MIDTAIAWQLARMDCGATEVDARAALAAADESLPVHERIAAAFALGLFGELGASAMAAIRADNVRISPCACASHDHCDANVIMGDAFAAIMGRDFLPDDGAPSDADCSLWNQAWNAAKRDYLTA